MKQKVIIDNGKVISKKVDFRTILLFIIIDIILEKKVEWWQNLTH